MSTTIIHKCDCTVCKGIVFTAPAGYVDGTPKQIRDMVHNYAQMVRNPLFGPRLAAKGVEAV